MKIILPLFAALTAVLIASGLAVAETKKTPTTTAKSSCDDALRACYANADEYLRNAALSSGGTTGQDADIYAHMITLCHSNYRQCKKSVTRTGETQFNPRSGVRAKPEGAPASPN